MGCSSVGNDDGWSARLMWRDGGALVSYLYYPDKPESIRCGEDVPWAAKITPGVWHSLRMRVKLNTIDGGEPRSDGVIEGWFDGDKVLSVTNVKLRRNPAVAITRTYLTTYCGGSIVELFAPSRDQEIEFRNIRSWPGPSENSSCEPIAAADDLDADIDEAGGGGDLEEDDEGGERAPGSIFDYRLIDGGRGWDRPGYFDRVRLPAGGPEREDVFTALRFCRSRCEAKSRRCRGFTLYGTSCYLKDASALARDAKNYGEGPSGWRYAYERDEAVVAQSGPRVPCGDIGQGCCYSDASSFDAPLCGAGRCATIECVCTGAVCASAAPCTGAEAAAAGAVCDQSGGGPAKCGSVGEPCCTGGECDEDLLCDANTCVG